VEPIDTADVEPSPFDSFIGKESVRDRNRDGTLFDVQVLEQTGEYGRYHYVLYRYRSKTLTLQRDTVICNGMSPWL
jgi:hypothetical protein